MQPLIMPILLIIHMFTLTSHIGQQIHVIEIDVIQKYTEWFVECIGCQIHHCWKEICISFSEEFSAKSKIVPIFFVLFCFVLFHFEKLDMALCDSTLLYYDTKTL